MHILAIHGINTPDPMEDVLARWRAALDRNAYTDYTLDLLYWGDLQIRNNNKRLDFDSYGRVAYDHLPRAGRTLHDRITGWLLYMTSPLVRQITRDLAEDVHTYFYDRTVRPEIFKRMAELMLQQPDLIIAHSMGSVIAMDYFTTIGANGQSVITIGSPLGNPWILNKLGYPAFPPTVKRWLNVSGDFDVVTWPDRDISDEYSYENDEQAIRDVQIRTPRDAKGQREPHSLHGYLESEPVVNEIFRTAMGAPQ